MFFVMFVGVLSCFLLIFVLQKNFSRLSFSMFTLFIANRRVKKILRRKIFEISLEISFETELNFFCKSPPTLQTQQNHFKHFFFNPLCINLYKNILSRLVIFDYPKIILFQKIFLKIFSHRIQKFRCVLRKIVALLSFALFMS